MNEQIHSTPDEVKCRFVLMDRTGIAKMLFEFLEKVNHAEEIESFIDQHIDQSSPFTFEINPQGEK